MGHPLSVTHNPVLLRISGADRVVPYYLWALLIGPRPKPTTFLESDGCSISPDTIGRLRRFFGKGRAILLFPACWIHDAHYRRLADLGGNWTARRKADWFLAQNLYALCRAQEVSRTGASTIAGTYWTAVRLFSAASYTFDEGQAPLTRFQRWREVCLAFRSKPTFA